MASSAVTIPVDAATIPISLMNFMCPPSAGAFRRLTSQCRSQRAFELDAEQLELARRDFEPVRVRDDTGAVEQSDDGVFAIEQRVDLFVDLLYVSAERLS